MMSVLMKEIKTRYRFIVTIKILSAGGDGNLKLWDLINNFPVRTFKEHSNEVFSCEWNHINKRKFLSAAYDRTIKLWDINMVTGSEATF